MVRRYDPPFPFHVAACKRRLEGMALQKLAQVRHLLEVLNRHRRHFEAARALGDDQALRGQPVEQLAQRADTDAIALLQRLELEPLRGLESPGDDVVPDSAIGSFASRFGNCPMMTGQHGNPMIFCSYDDDIFDH